MRIIDREETLAWLRKRDLLDREGGVRRSNVELAGAQLVRRFEFPEHSGVKTVLARRLADFFERAPESLLYVQEWGVFPSHEDQNLFRRLRQSLGETADIWEKPGHLFSPSDLPDVVSLVATVGIHAELEGLDHSITTCKKLLG